MYQHEHYMELQNDSVHKGIDRTDDASTKRKTGKDNVRENEHQHGHGATK